MRSSDTPCPTGLESPRLPATIRSIRTITLARAPRHVARRASAQTRRSFEHLRTVASWLRKVDEPELNQSSCEVRKRCCARGARELSAASLSSCRCIHRCRHRTSPRANYWSQNFGTGTSHRDRISSREACRSHPPAGGTHDPHQPAKGNRLRRFSP